MTKKPLLLWIIKFLLAVLGVASAGISGDKRFDFNKCYPMPATALIKECSLILGLSVLLPWQSNCQKSGCGGFQCLVQKTSDLAFLLFNPTNKNTRHQAGFPQITAFERTCFAGKISQWTGTRYPALALHTLTSLRKLSYLLMSQSTVILCILCFIYF